MYITFIDVSQVLLKLKHSDSSFSDSCPRCVLHYP